MSNPRDNSVITILLVDDDEVDAEAVVRGLRKNMVANPVVIERDGIAALERLRGENDRTRLPRPYIVLLDLNMPKMDGIEFLQALRADPDLEDSVVFMLTTSNSESDRVNAYREHVAGYMVKSEIGPDFRKAAEMLGHYWAAVSLPR